MKVLVIGGCGGLGQHVVQKLMEAGHDALIVDPLGEGSNETEGRYIDTCIFGELVTKDILRGWGIDLVIHVAEDLMNDRRMSELTIQNNVVGTAAILRQCIEARIPCWVGTWESESIPPRRSSMMSHSLHSKNDIIEQLSRRPMSTIRTMVIPRLIDFTTPSSNYMSIAARINRMTCNQYNMIFEEEIYSPPLQHQIMWSTPDLVASQIVDPIVGDVTKCGSKNLHGTACDITTFISILLHELGIESMLIPFHKVEPIRFNHVEPKLSNEIEIGVMIQNELRRNRRTETTES